MVLNMRRNRSTSKIVNATYNFALLTHFSGVFEEALQQNLLSLTMFVSQDGR